MKAIQRDEITVKSSEDQKRLESAISAGAIIVDSGRKRPFYFDGRFLTAADLTDDQNYFRARQSDIAQAMGVGIIEGLMVGLGGSGNANDALLVIQPGSGITPSGELVTINAQLRVRLNAVPESQATDAKMGIKLLPTSGMVNRTGLYVIALRAVEFSSNPMPSYPTSLDGTRSVHDGDIVEATAVTLIPYPDRSGSENAERKRARVAREIFFDGKRAGVLQQALPLAMVYIDNGALRWLDVYLVRREIGAESTLSAGLAPRPRALLEAWMNQFMDQIDDIPAASVAKGFPATNYFDVLPPVGLLPAKCMNIDASIGTPTLTQSFFPPIVDCEFAFVPSDEIGVMVDEGLGLPPIDLGAEDEDLDHLSILIVAAVSRRRLEQLKRELETTQRIVSPAAPGMLAKRSPLESLLRIAQPAMVTLPAEKIRVNSVASAWRSALLDAQNTAQQTNRGCFWYLRRRQLPYFSELSSATLRLAGTASALDAELNKRLQADNVLPQFNQLVARMPRLAVADTVNLLAAPRLKLADTATPIKGLSTSDVLRRSAMAEIAARPQATIEHAEVLSIARKYSHPKLGDGLDAMNKVADTTVQAQLAHPVTMQALVASGVATQIDHAANLLPETALKDFTKTVATLASNNKVAELTNMVKSTLKTALYSTVTTEKPR